ncbi:MAG: HNH endonuclease signature motif containing protein [bacterium]
MIINHTIREINPINQKELIETSSQLRNVLGKHMDIIKQLDPLPSEREKTKKFRKELIKSFGKFCAICNSDHWIDTHHIVPLEIGGETEIENLILLCKKHHTLCHSGYLSINSIKEISSEWRKGHKDFTNIVSDNRNVSSKPTIMIPPAGIKNTLDQVLVLQRERKLKKASELLVRKLNNSIISEPERNYLFIKLAEINRRRDMQGSLKKAFFWINNVDLNSLPKKFFPVYAYESFYMYRLAGFHEKALNIANSSAESLKVSEDRLRPLEYVAAVTNKILCKLAKYDEPTPSQVEYFINNINELKEIAQKHGEYWGGRWAINCAAHRLQIYVKAKESKKSLVELEKLTNLYHDCDIRTGWDSGNLQSFSLLKGLTSVLFLNDRDEIKKGVELLARSFCARQRRSQRFEGIRDIGFGISIGFRKLGQHLETAEILSKVMSRSIDGTSYIWPWIDSH